MQGSTHLPHTLLTSNLLEHLFALNIKEARRQAMNNISILSTNINSYTKQQHKQDSTLNFSDLFNQKTKEKISEPSQEPAKFPYISSSQNSLVSLNFNDLQAYGYRVIPQKIHITLKLPIYRFFYGFWIFSV